MIDQAGALQPPQVFWEEPGHKQGKVANVAMDFPLPIKRLRLEQHLGFVQHIHHGVDSFSLIIANLIELVGMREFHEQIGDILGHIEVGPPQMLSEALFGQGAEQSAQWMMLRDPRHHAHLPMLYLLVCQPIPFLANGSKALTEPHVMHRGHDPPWLSRMKVTGPSFSRETIMYAPNRPVATASPRCLRPATTCS